MSFAGVYGQSRALASWERGGLVYGVRVTRRSRGHFLLVLLRTENVLPTRRFTVFESFETGRGLFRRDLCRTACITCHLCRRRRDRRRRRRLRFPGGAVRAARAHDRWRRPVDRGVRNTLAATPSTAAGRVYRERHDGRDSFVTRS